MAAALALVSALPLFPAENPPILPLNQIHAGMKGVAYTIFSGDQIVKVNLTVLGVLNNALGPRQNIILVQLEGPEVQKTGVVAGMSGSPVYLDGKLAGAVSLKVGAFAKDAIAGVTPIQNMLDIENALPQEEKIGGHPQTKGSPETSKAFSVRQEKVALDDGRFLVPIETPLVFSGVLPQTLEHFMPELSGYGLTAMAGGTSPARPDDAQLQPGDMVGMELISGDLSAYAGCTVTTIVGSRVFACGHPLFSFGSVALPMTRAHVVTTLASSLESTKIMNTGGIIGTITQDRLTAVMGRLGAGPPMIPVSVNIRTPVEEKTFHFEVVENPKLTPLLVAVAAFNGVARNTVYTEGTTLQLDGEIELAGHPAVKFENMFAPVDLPIPDGFLLASDVQQLFARIYNNPYEPPKVEKVSLTVTSLPERRWASISNAWTDKSEVSPGETLNVKVLLRPYRGAPFIREVPIKVPAQTSPGNLEILVSDATLLNRMRDLFPGMGQERLQDLDELIRVINRERRNDRLYVTLLQNSPTLLVEDKELPNVPGSEINVLDQRQTLGSTQLLWQSVIGERSMDMRQVISGQQYLSVKVK